MTIPEQLAAALAEATSLAGQLKDIRAQLELSQKALEDEKAAHLATSGVKTAAEKQLSDVRATLAERDAKIAAVEKQNVELAAKEQDIAKRADSQAREIMAKVGQPSPVAALPNSGEVKTSSALTGVAAVEALYRSKYEAAK